MSIFFKENRVLSNIQGNNNINLIYLGNKLIFKDINLNTKPFASGIICGNTGQTYIASYTYDDIDGDFENGLLPTTNVVTFSGLLAVDEILIGSHNFNSLNNVPEGLSMFRWYIADDANGTNETVVSVLEDYIIVADNLNKYIDRGVIPVDINGNIGNEVRIGYNVTPISNALVERRVLISFGNSGKIANESGRTINFAHTNNPVNGYSVLNLVDDQNATTNDYGLSVITAFSDQNLGVTNPDPPDQVSVYDLSLFSAYWYPASGSRSFKLTGLTDSILYTIKVAGGTRFGSLNELNCSVGLETLSIANTTNKVDEALVFTPVNPSNGEIMVTLNQVNGLSTLCVLELIWKE